MADEFSEQFARNHHWVKESRNIEWLRLKRNIPIEKLLNDQKWSVGNTDDLELWYEILKLGQFPAQCVRLELFKKIEKRKLKKYENQVVDLFTEYIMGAISMGNVPDKDVDLNNDIMMSFGKRYSELFEL